MGYLVFSGSDYYPLGGWEDFKGSYPDLNTAIAAAALTEDDWWHVSNGTEVVASGNRKAER